MYINRIISVWFLLVVFVSCSYEFPETEQPGKEDFGTVDPQKFMAVGDDYIAGLMDGALYTGGQINSVAAILASQIGKMDSVDFNQAEINSENGLNLYTENTNEIAGKWIYQFLTNNDDEPSRVLTLGENVSSYVGDKSLLNDLSVPSLRIGQANNSELVNNPFFSRLVSSNENSTLLAEISQRNPSFIVLWIGMNDMLEYAIHGATGLENDPGTGVALNPNLTSEEGFRTNFTQLINYLLSNTESKIVIGNIISIQSLPYFYLRPYDDLFLIGNKLTLARSKYTEFNLAIAEHNRNAPADQQRPFIDFYDNGYLPHSQPLVVIDNALVDATYTDGKPLEKYRQLNKNEMPFISITDEMIEEGSGSTIPLDPEDYLSESEIAIIEERINSFNTILMEIANSNQGRVALADINEGVEPVALTGKVDAWGDPINNVETIYFDGVPVEGSLDMYSIYSLDGLHFNKRGNAFVTNIFIETVNNKFGSKIPTVNINKYTGNVYTFSGN